MVSLTRSLNTNSGGANFFSESVNVDDREHLQPILESFGVFKPLKTAPLFSLHLVYTTALNILAIVFAVRHPDQNSRCREYFILIYIHIGLWLLTLVVDQYTKRAHHNLRLNGYLDFYQKVYLHTHLPIYVVSLWSVALMLVQTIMQHFYPDNFAEKCLQGGMSPITYICALINMEGLCLLFIHTRYIKEVWKFNKLKAPPDVQKEEWEGCTTPENFGQNEVGYRQIGNNVFNFLEKQADLIRHLKEHNSRLSEKLMILSAQLHQARGGAPPSVPQEI
ncbi:unnamed protein product [Brassicogethes aeneus]|uniref:Transmembrane protein 192 n=1 Tax=Brassicogethes aeneus TaxID=1431903 RepID=A0A9P0AZ21_BRAAE|nr:unnamed protein product [Brassicogethes aeneus]